MHILIDIVHAANVHFYKRAISKLKDRHKITVLVRQRGDIVEFAKQELDVPIRVVGKHYKHLPGKLYGLFHRVIYLTMLYFRDPFQVITSYSGFYAAIAAKLLNIKSVIFYDNYEYRLEFCTCSFFSSSFVIPTALEFDGKNVTTYNGYKELAYLYHFKPSDQILREYNVQKKQYIFIRHIAHISLDHWQHNHEHLLERIVTYLRNRNISIVASIEQDADVIPSLFSYAHMIEKPTGEMLSLMHYARCVISSGDTVAREAALLGVPTLYIGRRNLRIHQELIREGLLKWPSEENAISVLESLLQVAPPYHPVEKHRWEDTTQVILNCLESQG